MTETDKKHYNLRSGSETGKLPVQNKMSDDSAFLANVVQQDQDSDSDESCDSELNWSAVAESSDNDHIHKQTHRVLPSTRSTFDTQSSLSDVAVQQAINVQILSAFCY